MNTNLSMNNIVDWTTTSDLVGNVKVDQVGVCLLYTSPSPRDEL